MKLTVFWACAVLMAATPVFAAAPAPAPVAPLPLTPLPYGRTVMLAEAKKAVAAAEAEAQKNGWTLCISVVEPNGAVVLSEKMDGTSYNASEIALRKAVTAATYRKPTSVLQQAIKDGNFNPIVTGAMALEGGELLVSDGKIIGAIGASGMVAAQDGVVARAGAAAIN